MQAQQWSGPLPPPAALEQFNNIIPDGANRILAMVEQEQAHRIAHETAELQARIGDTRRGSWQGTAITVLAIAAAAGTAYLGAHPTVSIAIVSLPIAAIVRAVLTNRSEKKKP